MHCGRRLCKETIAPVEASDIDYGTFFGTSKAASTKAWSVKDFWEMNIYERGRYEDANRLCYRRGSGAALVMHLETELKHDESGHPRHLAAGRNVS